jgi:phytanoyl-CoA hydroxylase
VLSDEQRRFFRKSGYLPLGRVSTPGTVRALKNEAARLVGDGGEPGTAPEDHLMRSAALGAAGHVRVALHLCHISDPFRAQALDAAVSGMVGSLFGEQPVALTSLLFNKPPAVGEALTLHQDLPYYPYLRDDDLITCWLALDETSADNGRVEYLPGTHVSRIAHRATGSQQALDIDPDLVDAPRAVGVSLAPGEAVLHHGLTVHRSAANTSGTTRMGLATLYVRSSAKVTREDFPYPLLVPTGQPTHEKG